MWTHLSDRFWPEPQNRNPTSPGSHPSFSLSLSLSHLQLTRISVTLVPTTSLNLDTGGIWDLSSGRVSVADAPLESKVSLVRVLPLDWSHKKLFVFRFFFRFFFSLFGSDNCVGHDSSEINCKIFRSALWKVRRFFYDFVLCVFPLSVPYTTIVYYIVLLQTARRRVIFIAPA